MVLGLAMVRAFLPEGSGLGCVASSRPSRHGRLPHQRLEERSQPDQAPSNNLDHRVGRTEDFTYCGVFVIAVMRVDGLASERRQPALNWVKRFIRRLIVQNHLMREIELWHTAQQPANQIQFIDDVEQWSSASQ
jgi:hypothetical protein